jgi:hypothetical protein
VITLAPSSNLILIFERTDMTKLENERIVESAVEARGAERGPTVRNVLVVSLALVVVAFAVIYFLFFRT